MCGAEPPHLAGAKRNIDLPDPIFSTFAIIHALPFIINHAYDLLIQPLRNVAEPSSTSSTFASSLPDPTELNNAPQGKPMHRATAVIKFRIIPAESERTLCLLSVE